MNATNPLRFVGNVDSGLFHPGGPGCRMSVMRDAKVLHPTLEVPA